MRPVLIDSGTVGARAKFTLGSLRMNEIPTGVIYGFLREIQKVYEAYNSSDFMFCWDSPLKTSLRKSQFSGYKEKRNDKRTKREKEEWAIAYEQYDILRKDILPRIGFLNQFYADGYEADDLLHVLAVILYTDEKPIMLTNDEDMYQSLPYCDILKTKADGLYTAKYFRETYGIHADQWHLVKAMAGCKSDSVPGIVGVGEKGAIDFLNGAMKRTSKKYTSIVSPLGQEIIQRNLPLVTLPFKDTPKCDFVWNKFCIHEFVNVCEELGMVSLLGQYSFPIWQRMLQ